MDASEQDQGLQLLASKMETMQQVMLTGFDTLAELARETNRRFDQTTRVMHVGFDTLADLLRETNGRIDETNHRLDDTNHRLDDTNHRLDETNHRLGRLEGRFDHFLDVAGGQTRSLREDVDRLTARVTALERDRSKS